MGIDFFSLTHTSHMPKLLYTPISVRRNPQRSQQCSWCSLVLSVWYFWENEESPWKQTSCSTPVAEQHSWSWGIAPTKAHSFHLSSKHKLQGLCTAIPEWASSSGQPPAVHYPPDSLGKQLPWAVQGGKCLPPALVISTLRLRFIFLQISTE